MVHSICWLARTFFTPTYGYLPPNYFLSQCIIFSLKDKKNDKKCPPSSFLCRKIQIAFLTWDQTSFFDYKIWIKNIDFNPVLLSRLLTLYGECIFSCNGWYLVVLASLREYWPGLVWRVLRDLEYFINMIPRIALCRVQL